MPRPLFMGFAIILCIVSPETLITRVSRMAHQSCILRFSMLICLFSFCKIWDVAQITLHKSLCAIEKISVCRANIRQS
jgi:hypothetical protein